jgi:hypothetical protein
MFTGEVAPERPKKRNSTMGRRKHFVAQELAKEAKIPEDIKDKLRYVYVGK